MKYLKKLKSFSLIVFAVLFLMGNMVSSCGTKSTEQTEEAAEHPEGSEHPSDSSEHPSDSTEHPAEHPSDSTAND